MEKGAGGGGGRVLLLARMNWSYSYGGAAPRNPCNPRGRLLAPQPATLALVPSATLPGLTPAGQVNFPPLKLYPLWRLGANTHHTPPRPTDNPTPPTMPPAGPGLTLQLLDFVAPYGQLADLIVLAALLQAAAADTRRT